MKDLIARAESLINRAVECRRTSLMSEAVFQRAYVGELVPAKNNEMGSVRVLSETSAFSVYATEKHEKLFGHLNVPFFCAFRRDAYKSEETGPKSPGGKHWMHRTWLIRDFVFRGQ
jgi:hypothetical protein